MAGKPIATVGSMHICPMCNGLVPHVGGPVSGLGAPNVLINGKPAALMGDMCVCTGPPDMLVQGNPSILINGVPVVSQGDMTAHGGVVMSGEPNILISTSAPSPTATMPLDQIPFPEIRLIDKLGAALTGNSANLAEAQGNIEAIQRGNAEVEPNIFNVRWIKEDNITRNTKIKKVIKVSANVIGIEDGESIRFNIERKNPNTGEVEQIKVSATVANGIATGEWEIAESNS